MIKKYLYHFIIFVTLSVITGACKQQQTVLPQENSCPADLKSIPDTTFEGTCTIYQKSKSLKGKITIAVRQNITKLIMMDELGVPLIVTSDSLDNCQLIRRFPPLTDEDAFITGLAITSFLRKRRLNKTEPDNCENHIDLKNSQTAVFYSNVKEKDLTKIVHNNDFYIIHHKNNEGVLANSDNIKLAQFDFNK